MRSLVLVLFITYSLPGLTQNDSAYKALVTKADAAYEFRWIDHKSDESDTAAFRASQNFYKEALKANPSASYPKDRIIEIDRIIQSIKDKAIYAKKRSLFETMLRQGDSLSTIGDYAKALPEYQKADSLIPGEATDISELTAEARDIENKDSAKVFFNVALLAKKSYLKFLSRLEGDHFDKEVLETAISLYKRAKNIKSNSIYVTKKLIELEHLKKTEPYSQERYEQIIGAADRLLKEKNLEKAKKAYELALEYKPNEAYPKKKIIEIEKLAKQK